MRKNTTPVRRLKLALSCKRKGKATEGFSIEWQEPEEKAIKSYYALLRKVRKIVEDHGLVH